MTGYELWPLNSLVLNGLMKLEAAVLVELRAHYQMLPCVLSKKARKDFIQRSY